MLIFIKNLFVLVVIFIFSIIFLWVLKYKFSLRFSKKDSESTNARKPSMLNLLMWTFFAFFTLIGGIGYGYMFFNNTPITVETTVIDKYEQYGYRNTSFSIFLEDGTEISTTRKQYKKIEPGQKYVIEYSAGLEELLSFEKME